ncbi:MAG: hypothetical protein HY738_21965 [Bacteroidia bacterium]|nr:hypothetical protein [Bacteroidia bacterium]
MNERIEISQVVQHKIKSVNYGDYYEEFDQKGNLIYEKGVEWPFGRSYKNIYDENNRMIKRYSFDENKKDTIIAELFKYNNNGLLREIQYSDTLVDQVTKYQYNSKNYIIKINDANGYESYKYDAKSNICIMKTDMKGEYLTNRTRFKWYAQYNEKNQLISETQVYNKNYKITWFYTYNENGQLIECKNDKMEEKRAIYIIKYFYNDAGLPVSRKYYDINDIFLYEQKIFYEFY